MTLEFSVHKSVSLEQHSYSLSTCAADPADTWRKNNVIITPKRRRDVVST